MRLILLMLAACFTARGHDIITTAITWDRDISRIFLTHCIVCHHPGGAGKYSMMTYAEARPWAAAIMEAVQRRKMPPWGAVKGWGDFRNDNSLALEEVERIVSWADGGAPEGEAKDLPKEFKVPPPDQYTHAKGELTASGEFALLKPFTLDGLWPRKVPEKTPVKLWAELPDGSTVPLLWLDEYNPQFGHPFLLRSPIYLPARTLIRGIPAGASVDLIPASKKSSPQK